MIKSKLKHILFDRKLTMKQVSEDTGLDRFFLGRLANNKVKDLKMEYLFTLCDYLKIQPGDLLISDDTNDNQKKMKVS